MKSDLVILYPLMYEDSAHSPEGLGYKSNAYIEVMDYILRNEVSDNISSCIERRFLGRHRFRFYKDFPELHSELLAEVFGEVYLALETRTNLCVCEIIFNFRHSGRLSYYLDAVSKDDVNILDPQMGELNMRDYLRMQGLEAVDLPKCCSFLSETPSDRELAYLVAAEFYDHDDEAFIESSEIDRILNADMSQYDFLKCYASPRSVVHIMRLFQSQFSERIYYEGLSIFIAELMMLNIAAIDRTNIRVKKVLISGAEPSFEIVKDINLEYAQTITLWNINIFKSFTAQTAAQKYYAAFEIEKLIEDYNRNQEVMEHIMDVKEFIHERTQDRILNIAAFVLTVIELCQFIFSIALSVINHENSSAEYIVGFSMFGGITAALIVITILRTRKKP